MATDKRTWRNEEAQMAKLEEIRSELENLTTWVSDVVGTQATANDYLKHIIELLENMSKTIAAK